MPGSSSFIWENCLKSCFPTQQPINPIEVESFLGLLNFKTKFILNLTTLAEPLRKLTGKEVKWHWTSEQQNAFDSLKLTFASAEVMAYYNPEVTESHLIVDGCPFGLGGILMQKQSHGDFRPVAYVSRTWNAVERQYSQTAEKHIRYMDC